MQQAGESTGAIADPALRLQTWRERALRTLFRVAIVAAPPVWLILLIASARERHGWRIAVPALVTYLVVLGLAMARRIPHGFRLWALLLAGHFLATATLVLSGLEGSGRVFLMALPLLAVLLGGRRPALVMSALGLMTFAGLAGASSLGWLANWPLAQGNQVRPIDWLLYGAGYAVTLVAVIFIQWRQMQLQESIAAEQAALTREAERLRAFNENIVQSMAEGIAVTDGQGTLTFVNPALAEFLEWEPEALVGRPWTALVAPECQAELGDPAARDWTEPNRFETQLLTATGRRVPVIGSSRPLFADGRWAGMLGAFTDVTGLKQAQDALRRSEEAARAVLNASTETIVLIDPEGRLLDLNQTAAERFRGEREALIGQGPAELLAHGSLPPEIIGIWMAHVREAVRTGKPVRREIAHTGLAFDVHITPILDDEGRVTRLALFSRNITAQRRAEQQATWAQRLAALGQLAGSLAHEINNPLQALRSNLELALTGRLDPDEYRHCLQVSLDEVARLGEVSHNLLALTVPGEERREHVPLGEPIRSTLSLVARQLQQAGVALTTDLPPDLPVVHVARNGIVQVLMNVIGNAIEAMPGGGHLHVAARGPGDRGSDPRGSGALAEITLANDGPPFSPEQLQGAFDPYFTTKPDHSGLGLFISHRIVAEHGGTITVENLARESLVRESLVRESLVHEGLVRENLAVENRARGQGVTFTIRLPVASAPENQESAA